MAALDTLVGRIIAPTGAVGFALFAEAHDLGLLHHLGWPAWMEMLTGVVAMDLAIYLQHRVFHYVPALWRLHRMHHADLDVVIPSQPLPQACKNALSLWPGSPSGCSPQMCQGLHPLAYSLATRTVVKD